MRSRLLGRSSRPKGMDVVGGQRPAQDLSQVNELFVCLFVSPLVITCFFLRIRFLYYFSDIHYIKYRAAECQNGIMCVSWLYMFSNAFYAHCTPLIASG